MTAWTAADIPDQTGRVAVVTGANSGIGLETARQLAVHGATVVLACRDEAKAADAARDVAASAPGAPVETVSLDLADLASVEAAAKEIADRHPRLDLLVNNAGLMATPYRLTGDGFELQMGVNHYGHFALTGRLLEALLAADAPRVVSLSSSAHRMGAMDFDNLDGQRGYRKWRAYGMSKLANLLFTTELHRRAFDAGLVSVAAHPGFTHTNLQAKGPMMSGSVLVARATEVVSNLVGQRPAAGALPTLFAATQPHVPGDAYIGPDGPFEARGHPKPVGRSSAASDPSLAGRLWEDSEKRTGVRYTALKT